jgi:hypothetical protein
MTMRSAIVAASIEDVAHIYDGRLGAIRLRPPAGCILRGIHASPPWAFIREPHEIVTYLRVSTLPPNIYVDLVISGVGILRAFLPVWTYSDIDPNSECTP